MSFISESMKRIKSATIYNYLNPKKEYSVVIVALEKYIANNWVVEGRKPLNQGMGPK